jgi:putative flippase GtrA
MTVLQALAGLHTRPLRGLLKRLIPFTFVSLPTTGLNIYIAHTTFDAGAHYALAVAAGFVCQITPESVLNRWWTFRHTGITWSRLFGITCCIEGLCFSAAYAIEFVGHELLHHDFLLVRLIAALITGPLSFVLTAEATRRFSRAARQ